MNFQELKEMVAESEHIVFFGGAGVSTESQIPDFRSAAGLFRTKNRGSYPPETILSHRFFIEHTEDFYDFYKSSMIYKEARPNTAHEALARLEKEGRLQAVITQNIDGLHQMAGSTNVLELHGSVHRNYCMSCSAFYDLERLLGFEEAVPRCEACGGIIKPDVVLYGETLDPKLMDQAADYISKADLFIVGGTSLTVNPAAGLIRYYGGNRLVLINQSPTPYDGYADYLIHDRIGKVLSALIPPPKA